VPQPSRTTPRRIAEFTQQIGACTDSADTQTLEYVAMIYDSSIVDLADRHNDDPFAYAPGAP
jgi:hypothetical protein